MFESRGVALAVVASVGMLVVGYVLGQATAALPPPTPVASKERLTAAEAKARSAENTFKDAQIAGLTARLGGGLGTWDGTPPRERPARFYETLREARIACGAHANVVGVECSEPPCIALLRQIDGDIAAELAACTDLTSSYPSPRITEHTVTCPSGRTETAVFVSPAAGERTPEVAVAEDARLADRSAALLAGWRCTQSVRDMAH